MKNTLLLLFFILSAHCVAAFDIAAYYWPAYHNEPRWRELGIFGDGRGEWQNVYEAKPKYGGHNQPRFPLWGFDDESRPEAMEKKISAAKKYGVNVFIFDWYWYEGKAFLEGALNEGFLKAKNCGDVKFYIMWANHTVNLTWNNKAPKKREKIYWRGEVSLEDFKNISDRMVKRYFCQPNYYRIGGKAVFCIYELGTFIKGVGGLQNAKKALDYMREKAKAAGGVHIQSISWNLPENLQGIPGDSTPTSSAIAEFLGIDSFTSYSWAHYKAPSGEYEKWGDFNVANWDKLRGDGKIPFFCHVSVGWDNNPRFPQRVPHISGESPAIFERYLRAAKDWTAKYNPECPLITVNSWNEWTEGSYLEPDVKFGYAYLEAVKKVFKENESGRSAN